MPAATIDNPTKECTGSLAICRQITVTMGSKKSSGEIG
jgi:hypothetical protein